MKGLPMFLVAMAAFAQADYDLLLKGGHVIDPKNGINARRDVAVKDGRVAEVAANIAASKALKVVDVSGLYVTPGLVDIHTHVFAGDGPAYTGENSVFPDSHSFRSGVTTVVDAGGAGWRNFADFKRRIIDKSHTRVLSMLNIVGSGMAGEEKVEQDTTDMDAKATAEAAKQNREFVVGIKTAHFRAPEWTAVDRAVEAGKLAGMPVMVDFGAFTSERPFEDLVLKKLRAGDIYTHTYLAAVPMLDDQGIVRPYLFEARKRGVIFDAGHGAGSFVFRQAVPAIRQGFLADSISTDLHINSMNAGMKDMLNVMSKFLNMGVALDDVILRSTWNPAREIRREELGHLSVGAVADIAVLRLQKGSFGFVDVHGARMKGTEKLVAELTVRDGRVVWDLNGITREDWDKLGNYRPQGDPRWDATLGRSVRSRR
ncbi:MAG TPA: amidohydrolase/deacetylase family metallohydrolase [Bryobacteraceae bacterium]|nr:amidohydrolase/deacetylase family metallohydrolase [Bryobacteraceae bacterium]